MSNAPLIKLDDHVIIYSSRTQCDSIMVTAGKEFQSRYGHYKHDQMVGKPYGAKFSSANGRGFVYLLRPTPELWTLALPHRTQILYLPDISFITSYLDVKAGTKIIEAGTGSGSLSHSLARTVGRNGKVYSYEYHQERFAKAKEEFKLHGLQDIIMLKHQNVYKDGFELVDEVDSVFLDLPAPWEAIGHAKKSLRKDRQSRICCFSPCIEQVIRTVNVLAEQGFSDIVMYETLSRSQDSSTYFAPDISTAIERIKGVEEKKERRRLGQINDAKRKRDQKKRKAETEVEPSQEASSSLELAVASTGEPLSKKAKATGETSQPEAMLDSDELESRIMPEADVEPELSKGIAVDLKSEALSAEIIIPSRDNTATTIEPVFHTTPNPTRDLNSGVTPISNIKHYSFKAGPQTRGHTSYLTFATLLPGSHLVSPSNVRISGVTSRNSLHATPDPPETEAQVPQTVSTPIVEVEVEEEFPIAEEDIEAFLKVDL